MAIGQERAEEIQRKLFKDICNEVTDRELDLIKQELKQKAFGGFKSGEIERELKTTNDILEKLKRKGLIKIGDYGILRKLAGAIESQPLLDYVAEAENSLAAIHWPVKQPKTDPSPSPMPGAVGYGAYGGHHAQFPVQNTRPPPPYHHYDDPQPYQPTMGPPQHQAPRRQQHRQYQDSPTLTRHQQPGAPIQQNPYQQGGVAPSQLTQPTTDPHYSHQDGGSSRGRRAEMQLRSGSSSSRSIDDVFLPERRNIPFDNRTEYEPGKGYVLFINNMFTRQPDYRRGAEADETNVRNLFSNTLKGYFLQYMKDVTYEELRGYLESFKDTLSTGVYKSFILILGTHGEPQMSERNKSMKDAVLMADNKWMMVEDIVNSFHGDQIPAMKDKPKVFIIQSCRGKTIQRSVSLSDSPAIVSDTYPRQQPEYMTRPVNSDILIAYATSEGTKAWRNEDEGSWFVKDLCDVITEYCEKEHMLDILVRVNSRMVWREATENRGKQMPCFVCTFTKKFMLAYPNK
ncbi:cell death protein 3-like [Lytechinus variegatus]|uniref:cell death protein 3-like n=1 Tax=Lytechinus variegatus TaxID=7654 RepID=UPI001BB21283|nr:cell death protein 3-like [Lytechinus variegatus]XP_041481229.1 cell death protein 3-like [Lytechinus variegatus]XP_041481230.1 cell death protein 3-like [Lytechinus variegatus]